MTEKQPVQLNLPFWETVKRSFMFVLKNMKTYLKISAPAFAIVVYEMLCGFPILCNINPESCTPGLAQRGSLALLWIVSFAVTIAFCRVVVLKTPADYFSLAFLKRECKYILYNLLLVAAIMLPAFLLIAIVAFIGSFLGMTQNSLVTIGMFIPLLLTIYAARLFLVFPGIAVDDAGLTIQESFRMTKGNANKIFWAQIIMMLPCGFLLVSLSSAYILLKTDNYFVNLIFVLLYMALSFLDSCFKASFYGHIYQYFTFYKTHDVPSEDK